jgi:hypothetical protein
MKRLIPFFFTALSSLFSSNVKAQTFSIANFQTLPATNAQFSSTAWADYDNDGDLDLIATGLDASSATKTQIYNNALSGFTAVPGANLPNVYNGSVNWGDFNNDGLLDLVITGDSIFNDNKSAVSKIFKNTGSGFVEVFKGSILPMHLGDTQWVDYDNDGLLDLIVTGIHPVIVGGSFTDQYFTKVYKNGGGSFSEVFANQFASVGYSSIDVADFDTDGLPDFAVTGTLKSGGTPPNQTFIYRNTGSGFIAAFSGEIAGVSFGDIKWWDYDRDGKTDIVVCGATGISPIAKVYKNNGNGFTEVFANTLAAGSAGVIDLGDYDNDGDLDLVHNGSYGGVNFSEIVRNDSNAIVKVFHAEIDSVQLGTVSWGDSDGDGDLDILVYGLRQDNASIGKVYINSGSTNTFAVNQRPLAPTLLSQNISHSNATLSWNTAADAETPAAALHYNIYVRQNTDTLFNSQSLKSGKRKVVSYGNMGFGKSLTKSFSPGDYQWAVQSIDNDYQGSAFTAESSFHINFPPKIDAITPYTIFIGDTVMVKPGDITVTDADNSYPTDFTIDIHPGSNYTVLGNKIIPSPGFVGIINVAVSVNDGKDDSNVVSAVITVKDKVTEIIPENSALSVFPNPFKESVSIDFGNDEWGNAQITVIDVNGKQQEFGVTKANETTGQIDNVKSLSQGVYIIRITLENKVVMKKVVKL